MTISEKRGVPKKKKSEGPIKRLVHKIMIYVVLVTGLSFLLQFIYAGLKFKYWIVHLGHFVIHVLKAWKGSKDRQNMLHYQNEIHHIIPSEKQSHSLGAWQNQETDFQNWNRQELAFDMPHSQEQPQSWWDWSLNEK